MKKQIKLRVLAGTLFGILAFQLASLPASAVTGTVIKSKGKKVLIELPLNPHLQPGDTVAVDTVELRSPASGRLSPVGRHYTFGGGTNGAELHFYSQSNGYPGSTVFNINARGGWNDSKYEYGPIALIYYSASDSNNSLTTFGLGGFFDLNLVPNAPGISEIYGIGGDAEIASSSIKIGGTSVSAGGVALNGGGFYKFFLFKSDTCLRFDADLHVGIFDKYTETGIRFLVGVQTYF